MSDAGSKNLSDKTMEPASLVSAASAEDKVEVSLTGEITNVSRHAELEEYEFKDDQDDDKAGGYNVFHTFDEDIPSTETVKVC